MACVVVSDKWGSTYAHNVPDVDNESLWRGALTVAYENSFDTDEFVSIGYSNSDDPGWARLDKSVRWIRSCKVSALGDE